MSLHREDIVGLDNPAWKHYKYKSYNREVSGTIKEVYILIL